MSADNTRLLFVIDNDYGELTMAMLLLHGQPMAERTTIALPPKLYSTNKDGLGVGTCEYRSLAELVQVIDVERPDIVFLFSGYLFQLHGLLTAEQMRGFINHVRARGGQVVTYDPFWGLMSSPNTLIAAQFLSLKAWPIVKIAKYLRARRAPRIRTFSESASIIKHLVHVNPAPMQTNEVNSVTFFNPCLTAQGADPAESLGFARDELSRSEKPVWLFVLAEQDYAIQKLIHAKFAIPFVNRPIGGRDRFADIMVASLRQALRAGRHPVVLAPRELIAAIESRMGGEEVGLITACPYHRFMSLLVSAEYAFYWNAMSSSSLIRLFNHLPIFYFDRGHVPRTLTPVYARMIHWFYQGWEPKYLDQRQELSVDVLQELASDYRRATAKILEALRDLPSPGAMIDQIIQQGVDSELPPVAS